MNKEDLRIVFMGTPEIASVIAGDLISDGYNVVLGLCQPDKPVGRKQILTAPPVKVLLEEKGIPVFQPGSLKTDESFEYISSFAPDLVVTCAYGKILPQRVLDIPKFGCLNVHASLLPKKRGSSPVQRAILDGDEKTGITIMRMDAGLDTGDMVSVTEVPIDIDMHSSQLFEVLGREGSRLLRDTILPYVNGEIELKKQNGDEATYCPPISSEEGHFLWSDSAFAIHKRVHALSTWPGAYTYFSGKKIKIYDTSLVDSALIGEEFKDSPAGTIVKAHKKDLFVKTGDGYIAINILQPEGGKRLNSIDCAHNYKPGQIFQDQ